MTPILYIFSGLPGTGKSTLAKKLAEMTKSSYFRIDTIEQGIRDLFSVTINGEGYRLTYRIVEDNLKLGVNVISDSCNPWKLTREEWEAVALKCNARFVNIEVVCSNKEEHKRRIENRNSEVERLKLPNWEEVVSREYHKWEKPHIVIDTSKMTIDESIDELMQELTKWQISKEQHA